MPTNAAANNIFPSVIPECLRVLNSMEKRMISRVNIFITMYVLPNGGQYATKGNSISFVNKPDEIVKTLPRAPRETGIILVRGASRVTSPYFPRGYSTSENHKEKEKKREREERSKNREREGRFTSRRDYHSSDDEEEERRRKRLKKEIGAEVQGEVKKQIETLKGDLAKIVESTIIKLMSK